MTRRRSLAVGLILALAVAMLDPASALAAAGTGSSPPSAAAIVGFAPGRVPPVAIGGTLVGLPVTAVSRNGGFVGVRGRSLDAVRRAVAPLPGVAYVEEDLPLHALVTPSDTRYGEQYGPGMMGFPAAWGQVGYGSSSVIVSVIDSGVRRTHQDLTGGRVLQGHDYVSNDNDPSDDCGHGTHTTGTVGATTNNGTGVAGMSQAKLLPMRALSAVGGLLSVQCTGSTSSIATAITDSADQGAKVISMSIGGGGTTTLENAVNYAWNKGVLLVAAAGNDGASNSVDYPAAYPNVIAVAALDANKTRASYSDMGPQLGVAAPGSDVLSTYNSNDTSYTKLSGTSMATPHVSGALALALSCAPAGTTNTQMRSALYSTAEDLGTPGFDQSYGNGLARADRLVAQVCGGTPPPGNSPPTASFTSATSGLTVTTDASASTDPDGDPLTYSWAWGDGTTASGVTASHAYAAAGSYTITLTVADGRGGTNQTTRTVTVASSGDPDPSTPTVTSGQTVTINVTSTTDAFYKISVPAGKAQLQVVLAGPSCGLLSCSVDADLSDRAGARPTDTVYACRPYTTGNNETCTHASPDAGWWYMRVKRYSGSGTVTLKATVS